MSENISRCNFFNISLVCERKATSELSGLKNSNLIICYLLVEEKLLESILEERDIMSRLVNNEEGVDRVQTSPLDDISTVKLIASVLKSLYNSAHGTKVTSSSYKMILFVPEKCNKNLETLVLNLINDTYNCFEEYRVGKSDLLVFLETVQVWTFGSDYEDQLIKEELINHFILKGNSNAVQGLVDFGCKSNFRNFIMRADHKTIKFITNSNLITNDVLKSQFLFHYIVYTYTCDPGKYLKLEQIFHSIAACVPSGNLTQLLYRRSPCHAYLNVMEYACRIQADRILELILNSEKGFKTTDNAINYDVSNVIPDTVVKEENEETDVQLKVLTIEPSKDSKSLSKVSYLERIIASSRLSESRAAKMLEFAPITYLIEDYILVSKLIRILMFLVQLIFMSIFTWYNINRVSYNFASLINDVCNSNETSDDSKNKPCSDENLSFPGGLSILWLIWPALSLIYSIYKYVAISRLISNCDAPNSIIRTLITCPWLDLMILVCLIIWFVVVLFQVWPESYFNLVAFIFIVGWLRAALYISFCSHWHGFVVALKSSLTKYFISFVFVFIFIYIGFSCALRILLTEYKTADKPLYIVAFTTLVTVFGMGNLDEMPSEVDKAVGRLLFLKLVIICYCSLIAILVLAIIRQPDTELVIRVGSELFPRLRLGLLKDVVWLMRWRRSRDLPRVGEPILRFIHHQLHELLNMKSRLLKKNEKKYVLRVLQEDISADDDTVNLEQERETVLKEVMKLQSYMEELGKKIERSTSQ